MGKFATAHAQLSTKISHVLLRGCDLEVKQDFAKRRMGLLAAAILI